MTEAGNVRTVRRPNDQFVMVPNAFARDPQIPPSAFRVAVYIMSHTTSWQVSQESIGRALEMSAGTVASALRKLADLGYAHRQQQHDHNGRRPDIITISCEPLSKGEWERELAGQAPTAISLSGESPSGETEARKNIKSKKTILEEDHQGSSSPAGDAVLPGMPEPILPEKAIDIEFEGWWRSYPRKVGKDAARIKYRAARKGGASEQVLADALAAHAAGWEREQRVKEYIPHAATWLNQGRYNDEDLPGSGGAGRATNTRYDGAYWAGQQTEERDENGYTAEDRLMMERHGVTISYGHGK